MDLPQNNECRYWINNTDFWKRIIKKLYKEWRKLPFRFDFVGLNMVFTRLCEHGKLKLKENGVSSSCEKKV